MKDWHCHLLPGLDDGPDTLEDSITMAGILSAAGFREVYCTPHCIKGVWENTPDGVRGAVAELQRQLVKAGIPLTLKPGIEYYLDEFFPGFLENPQTLGDSSYILVEAPSRGNAEGIKENVSQAIRRGLKPVLAHPERNPIFSHDCPGKGFMDRLNGLWPGRRERGGADAGLIAALRGMGCLFQGNLGSLAGRYGKEVQARASLLLRQGVYSCFGSDAHRAPRLKTILASGLEAVKGRAAELP